jgi:hypothetical protein
MNHDVESEWESDPGNEAGYIEFPLMRSDPGDFLGAPWVRTLDAKLDVIKSSIAILHQLVFDEQCAASD